MADPASLSNLRDIVEPATISLWPSAPGQILLCIMTLLWVSASVLLLWQRRQRNTYRRVALHELANIEEQIKSPQTRTAALRQLSILLKRVALAVYPRCEIASLTGNSWIAFLDQSMGGNSFSKGPVKVITSTMFEEDPGADLTTSDCNQIIQTVRRWITSHRVEEIPSATAKSGG